MSKFMFMFYCDLLVGGYYPLICMATTTVISYLIVINTFLHCETIKEQLTFRRK